MILSFSVIILGFIVSLKNKNTTAMATGLETKKNNTRVLLVGMSILFSAGPLGMAIFFISNFFAPGKINILVIAGSTVGLLIFGIVIFIIGFFISQKLEKDSSALAENQANTN